MSVPGHEVRQDTATFTLTLTLMDITLDAAVAMFSTNTEYVRVKLQRAAIWATWDIPKATILDESSHCED